MIDITTIFCVCDDFCKIFSEELKLHAISSQAGTSQTSSCAMTTSEMMSILISFHLSGFHDFKHFYVFVQDFWKKCF